MWSIERLSQHLPLFTCKILNELVLVDKLLALSQDRHKGNGPEWSLGSAIICLVVLKIGKCFSSLFVNYWHTML